MSSRIILRLLFGLTLLLSLDVQGAGEQVIVFKTPTCGCCKNWVEHLKKNGFQVKANDVESTAEYRRRNGVPDALQSCHTATVGGYSIEGHVPAADIQRLLKERPKAKGLAVAGMPLGSPGMEAERSQSYNVVLFDAAGRSEIYSRYPGDK